MLRRRHLLLTVLAALGCRGGEAVDGVWTSGSTDVDEVGTTAASSDSGSSDSGSSSSDGSGSDGSGDESDGTKFDLAGGGDLPLPPPMIPATCAQAESGETSVGCLFYTVDLDSNVDFTPFAVVVANVQSAGEAEVLVERKLDGVWTPLAGPVAIPPYGLHEFAIAEDFHREDAGVNLGGAYRVSADLPVIAYQFNPIDGQKSYLSDASLLYPVASWDHHNQIVNYADAGPSANPFLTVAAAHDGTAVTITPSVSTLAGPGVPASAAGVGFVVMLDAGDTAVVEPEDPHADLSGTRVESDPDRPVAVFSGHGCANIPADVCCCDHLEEQLTGVRLWGRHFVAGHMPLRDYADPEATLWQIYASEDGTTVSLDAAPGVQGLPGPSLQLDAGEVANLYVRAATGLEADFRIDADKPIAVVAYMLSAGVLGEGLQSQGDPAMVHIPPTEQFLPHYVVLIPGTWDVDMLVLTRRPGSTIYMGDYPIDEFFFAPVGDGEWEVARFPSWDGVHLLESDGEPFGVYVVGWDDFDSYAYVGGAGTVPINPQG